MAKKKTSSRGQQFDLDRYLSKTKSKWKEAAERAKENKGGFAEFDDGKYVMRLVKAEANKSQAGRPQVVSSWKFMDGDYKGQVYKSYRGIDSADNMYYFLLDAKRLGYDIDEFETSDLPDLLKQMSKDKPTISASLRSKGEYQNVLINKILDEDDLDEDDEDDEDDDEPKKKKKSKKRDDDEDEDDEDSDDEDDDEEEDEKPRRKKKSKKDEDDEDEEEDEEEEDDEDEKPRRKKKASKSDDDDEDDEDEEDEDDEDDEPKRKKKRSKKSDDDEEDDKDEDDGDEVAVTVGSLVKVKLKAGTTKAEVVEVLEDDQAVRVKTKEGKTVKVSADKILSVEPPKKKKRRS